MRRSKLKTTVAVLRDAISQGIRGGMGQKEFAALVGRSVATIQSLELGRLELSDDLAQEISRQTGADVGWLLKNDVEAAPVDFLGCPFTPETFENSQAGLCDEAGPEGLKHYGGILHLVLTYAAAALAAKCAGKLPLFAYKAGQAVQGIADQFGEVDVWQAFPGIPTTTPGQPLAAAMEIMAEQAAHVARTLPGLLADKPESKAKVKSAGKKVSNR